MRVLEVPIPTYYGEEISHVNGLRYAWDVTRDVLGYRLQKMGFGDGRRVALGEEYQLKESPDSSHGRILGLLAARPRSRILDLGCSSGQLTERLHAAGHEVTGVDVVEVPGVRRRMTRFVAADLDAGIPAEAGTGYDVVLAADVLEHLREPERLLRDARQALRVGGSLIVCVPNIGHWYPRFRTMLGQFDYDQRGPLDRGHLRFFTRRSIKRLLRREGFTLRRVEPVGLPFDVVGVEAARGRWLRRLDSLALSAWPTLFGYQFILEAERSGDHDDEGDQEGGRGEGGESPASPLARDRGGQHEHEQRPKRDRIAPRESGIDVVGEHQAEAEGHPAHVQRGHSD
jgi:2-polyprenyl-3-methyl-5-hydroxy-6-metoxy-1,4-benzoquinol methylase